MSDTSIELPQVETTALSGHDGDPIHVIVANGTNGLQTKVVDIRAEAPAAFLPRTVAARHVTDTASFLAETRRRPLIEGQSTVWANRNTGKVSVIYDDLDADPREEYTHRGDILVLQFVQDLNWRALMKVLGAEPCGQIEFSDLIESVGHLITSHETAELMEIVESLRTTSKGEFESTPNRANGSQVFTFTEQVNATAGRSAQLEVPQTVTFRCAPFEDFPPVDVTCWFRFRVHSGTPRLTLDAQPFDHVIRETWTSVVDDLAENLGVPVYATNLN